MDSQESVLTDMIDNLGKLWFDLLQKRTLSQIKLLNSLK